MTNEDKIRSIANRAYIGREQWMPFYLKRFMNTGTLGDLHGVEDDIRNQRATAATADLRELYDLLRLAYRAAALTAKEQ